MSHPRLGHGQGRGARSTRHLPRLSLLLILTCMTAVLSVLVGTRFIDPTTVLSTLTGHGPEGIEGAVIDARITRTLWGLIIGATLGLAGAGMQGITRNPLGDPGILGVNSGAAFAVVTGITFLGVKSTTEYSVLAFVGAAAASALVYAFASIGKDGATPVKLALMGAALSAGLGSLTSALILTRQNAINNLALGDDMAASLGENVNRRRFILFIGITLLVGAAVALAGPIAFLGLMAPHAMRSFISADYRVLLPSSALFGAVILLLADTIGRVLMPPQEIQVGVSTIVVGVPVFIYLIRRSKGASLS